VIATTTASRRPGLSLETRIFLVTSLLIALLVGGAVAVTSVLLRGIARSAVLDSLKSSATAQKAFQDQRYQQLHLMARLFATDPYLAAYLSEAVGSRDIRSILDLLNEKGNDFKYDLAMVLDPDGRLVARTDQPATGQDLSKRALIATDPELEARPAFLFFKGAANGLFDEGAARLRKGVNDQQALLIGIKCERGSHNFFKRYGERFEDSQGKQIFLEFAREEREHLELLIGEYRALTRRQRPRTAGAARARSSR